MDVNHCGLLFYSEILKGFPPNISKLSGNLILLFSHHFYMMITLSPDIIQAKLTLIFFFTFMDRSPNLVGYEILWSFLCNFYFLFFIPHFLARNNLHENRLWTSFKFTVIELDKRARHKTPICNNQSFCFLFQGNS